MWLKKIFYIKSSNQDDCQIHSNWLLLKNPLRNFKSFLRHQIVVNNQKNYLQYFPLKPIFNKSKLIVFGIKDSDYPVFLTSQKDSFIDSTWYDQKNKNAIAIFFMPEGVKLLENLSWKNKFSGYITFKKNFDFLLGLKKADQIVQRMNTKLFESIFNLHESKEIKSYIKKIYDQSIIEMGKYADDADYVMSIYKIRTNIANLVSDQD